MANQPAKEAGEFNLIIAEVEAAKLNDAARDFSAAFSIDETIAQQICKSAPIIFAQKLTKSEVKAITPKLTELSAKGIEFRVTARLGQKMPKVNWPIRPQFTAGGSGGPNGLAFEWENNAFVCPNCRETFLFRRLGPLKLAEAPEAPAPAARAAAPAAKAAPAPAPRPAARPAPAPAPVEEVSLSEPDIQAEPAGQLEGVEGVEPLGESESLELPGAVEEISLNESDVASPAESPVVPLEAESEASAGPAGVQAPQETATAEDLSLPEEAPAAAAEEAPAAAPAANGEQFNVFLSKITDASKRDKAAELIAKVKGCTVAEAKELTTRLVIPLAKNVSKEQADDVLNQFKKLKIFGRMTKVK